MKYFIEVYVWLVLAILMLIACAQHIVAGNTYTGFGCIVVGVIFLYVFKKEKSRFN